RLGGHLGPITCDRRGRKIRPLSIAPWAEEKIKTIPLLDVLRGDFFCMPFGGNETPFGQEKHPPHGETANAVWKLESIEEAAGRHMLHASLRTKVRKGRVDKRITLIDGHNAVYCRHVISGMTGPMNLGHHAMLKFPDEEGCGLISTSPFTRAQVFIQPTELPANQGYSCLKPGAEFKTLSRVPTVFGTTADLSRYPARRGYEDIVQLLTDPRCEVAWTAVSFPKYRYVWFSLRDPKVLSGTLMWHSNGGRYYAPWNGRHVNVLGLEDVTTYFHLGLAEAARNNPHTANGYSTALTLRLDRPTVVNYIMAVAPTPPGFDRVKTIDISKGKATLRSESGKKLVAPLDTGFLAE
ncbi:MAG TPA: hypothetical protein VLM89_07270, partial [Phycisphaerae bacterium]|nr:hypothetical protein [Phycisphaerae bacterium]